MDVNLLILELLVFSNDLLNQAHVRKRLAAAFKHEVSSLRDTLPAFHSFEDTQVSQHHGWGPDEAGGAVDKYLLILFVNKTVQVLCSHKHTLFIILLIIIN